MAIDNKVIITELKNYIALLEFNKSNRAEHYTTYVDKKITMINEQIKELKDGSK